MWHHSWLCSFSSLPRNSELCSNTHRLYLSFLRLCFFFFSMKNGSVWGVQGWDTNKGKRKEDKETTEKNKGKDNGEMTLGVSSDGTQRSSGVSTPALGIWTCSTVCGWRARKWIYFCKIMAAPLLSHFIFPKQWNKDNVMNPFWKWCLLCLAFLGITCIISPILWPQCWYSTPSLGSAQGPGGWWETRSFPSGFWNLHVLKIM